ncbi:MAG: transporter permease, partial [Frankiales bacterium]|nr:transporter permease [Frankiales bacterium]
MSAGSKVLQMLLALLAFGAVVGLVLLVAGRVKGRRGDAKVAAAFLLPTVVALLIGLIYPAARTIGLSFFDAAGHSFIGLDNYTRIFSDHDQRIVLRNTFLWVVVTPFIATAIGLLYAILVDRARLEALAKA